MVTANNAIAYYASFAVCLSGAVSLLAVIGRSSGLLLFTFVFFLIGAALFVKVIVRTAQGRLPSNRFLERIPGWSRFRETLRTPEPMAFTIQPALVPAFFFQILIFILDSLTLLVCLYSLGISTGYVGVYVSYMVALLAQTIAMVPGGLGIYEFVSTTGLSMSGLSGPEALAATLVFRGLSYWLPLLPGLWYARRVMYRRRR